MKPKTQVLLVRRLASLEAAWKPARGHEWDASGAIYEARRTGGVRFWGDGGDGRARKADQRSRDEASAAGLLRGESLTDRGKRVARGLCWPFTTADLERALLRLLDAVAAGWHMKGSLLVPEVLIAGADWGDQVAWLQALFVPLLADGILVSESTYSGRVFYRTADIDTLDAVGLSAEFVVGEFEPSLSELYNREFKRSRDAMLCDRTSYQEIGHCPLVVRQLESGRDQHDLTGIELLFDTEAAVDG